VPRKRRHPKRRERLPQGVAEISLCERSQWSCYGPSVGTEFEIGDVLSGPRPLYHVWPDWKTWTEFYSLIRDEIHGDRQWRRESSAAERIYQAWLRGDDPDRIQDAIQAEVNANDPRRFLRGAHAS
jgi:hypothetical protein